MEKLGIVIQVRTGSSRLPNKSILPFYREKGIFELLLDKLISNFNDIPIIVATTTNPNDDVICSIVDRFKGIEVYRGSEANVLDRFVGAAKKYSLTKLIRICSDNPFLEVSSLNKLICRFNSTIGVDYLCYQIDGLPSIKTHYGFWAEAVSLDALIRIAAYTNETLYVEHVTNYIYTNPHLFNIDYMNTDYSLNPKLRLTVDNIHDFELQHVIFEEMLDAFPNQDYEISDVIDFLDKNAEFYDQMYLQQLNNSK